MSRASLSLNGESLKNMLKFVLNCGQECLFFRKKLFLMMFRKKYNFYPKNHLFSQKQRKNPPKKHITYGKKMIF